MGPAWSFALARLAAAIGLAVTSGLIFGRVDLWLVAVLAAYLLLQLANLYRLHRWLRHRSEEDPPDLGGVWGDVVALVGRIYRRKQFHKRRVVQLFREFRRLTAAMPEGVLLLTNEREILWFNRTAAVMLGLHRKADFGMRIENLVRHPDFARYIEAGPQSAPVTIRSSQGADERFLAFQLIPAAEQQLLLVRDITRETRLEAMRKDFVANASHELRSPLTVVAGYLDQLADDHGVDPVWKAPIEEMRRQAERMRLIVEDLLELSRLEASDKEAPYDPVDLGGMLALLRKEALARVQRPREITLQLDSDRRLLGSETELHSIATNLVSNACKFTPAEGSVTIRWWVDAEGGHLSVRDTGIGIPAEHVPRLTERFYRVDKGRSRKSGGSGLGLAIVKHALQRHGGRLAIDSVEGRGSTFTCHFPAKRVA
jgi:two-component system, OmpR family, phosphate regulon sensor histidine kinase PhoR